jgi:hypothetical protein
LNSSKTIPTAHIVDPAVRESFRFLTKILEDLRREHPTVPWETPGQIGLTTPNTGAFTTLSASSIVSTGIVDVSAAGAGQVKFPAAQNASANVNTLDDYEEGTWTPSDGSGAGLTLTVDHATYTKVGNRVSGQALITYPVTGSGAGSQISGLPFASAKQTACVIGGTAGNVVWGLISGTSIFPEPVNAGGILNSAISAGTFWISFSYYV